MAINTSRVVMGGLAAGLVMNVSGFVVQGMMLGPRMMSEMNAAAPSLQGKGESPGVMAARVATQFVVGLLVAWLYAAMRPRFGAGMKTAVYAALVVWLCGFLFYLDWLYLGLMSAGLYAMVSVAMVFSSPRGSLAPYIRKRARLRRDDAGERRPRVSGMRAHESPQGGLLLGVPVRFRPR